MKSATKYVMKTRLPVLIATLLTALSLLTVSVSAADREKPAVAGTPDSTVKTAAKDDKKVIDYSPYPNPDSGYVSDFAHLMTPKQQEVIEQLLRQVEDESKCEIIVVTIDSTKDYKGTDNQSIEKFATALFNKYGIGNMPKNDGILLLIAYKDRKIRIELGKYYGRAKDMAAAKIINGVIAPQFKKGNYAEGIKDGVVAIVEEFTDLSVTPLWYRLIPIVLIIVAIIVLIMVSISLFKKGKKGWGWVTLGAIFILVLLAIQLIVLLMRASSKISSAGPSSGWSAGGSGGFGGGSSGGGGATGGW